MPDGFEQVQRCKPQAQILILPNRNLVAVVIDNGDFVNGMRGVVCVEKETRQFGVPANATKESGPLPGRAVVMGLGL